MSRPALVEKQLDPPVIAAVVAGIPAGTLTNGTAYEYVAARRSMDGAYTDKSSAVSATVTSTGSLRITVTGAENSTLVLWRGASGGAASAPTRYVEIPLDAPQTRIIDTGANVNGRPWITTSVPVPNTVAATNQTYPRLLYPDGTTIQRVGGDRLLGGGGESTIRRDLVRDSNLAPGSGSVRPTFFFAQRTETISQIKIRSGVTAAGATPTLVRLGVFVSDEQGNLTLVASTANDTTLFAATNTAYTKALSASFTKVAGLLYAFAPLTITAAAVPNFLGCALNAVFGPELLEMPPVVSNFGSQSDLPATIARGSQTSTTGTIYAELLP